jgi:glycerophosphoryl diester phosphodiesterase
VALLSIGNFLVTTLIAASFGALLIELYKRTGQTLNLDDFSTRSDPSGLRLNRATLLGLLIGGAVVSILVGLWLIQGIQTTDDLTIVAHRGAAGKAPENTMASIRQAIEDNADWVEIDVQETADGQVVVIHDSDFMKLAGVELKVWEGTLEQVQQIDVGSWFGSSFAGERVPTLRDVLMEIRGRAKLVIELKYYGHDEQLEQRVVDLVEETGMVEDTALMSLKYDAVVKLRKLRPDWKTGLLSAQVVGDMSGLDVDFLAVNSAMAGPAFIRHNQQAGKQVFAWTVNDKMSMFKMMSLGVDGIITDEPELARQVIAERGELSSVERLLIHTAVILGKSLPQKAYRDNSP